MRIQRISILGGSGTGDIEAVLAGRGLYGGANFGEAILKSDFDIKEFPFTWIIEPAYVLFTVVTGERIKRVAIQVTEPFNDGAATIRIGHSGNPGGLMDAGDNKPGRLGIFSTYPEFRYGGLEDIKLYVAPASSTQGSGIVFIDSEIT